MSDAVRVGAEGGLGAALPGRPYHPAKAPAPAKPELSMGVAGFEIDCCDGLQALRFQFQCSRKRNHGRAPSSGTRAQAFQPVTADNIKAGLEKATAMRDTELGEEALNTLTKQLKTVVVCLMHVEGVVPHDFNRWVARWLEVVQSVCEAAAMSPGVSVSSFADLICSVTQLCGGAMQSWSHSQPKPTPVPAELLELGVSTMLTILFDAVRHLHVLRNTTKLLNHAAGRSESKTEAATKSAKPSPDTPLQQETQACRRVCHSVTGFFAFVAEVLGGQNVIPSDFHASTEDLKADAVSFNKLCMALQKLATAQVDAPFDDKAAFDEVAGCMYALAERLWGC